MNHCLLGSFDVTAVKVEVFNNYDLFFLETYRQDHPTSSHKDTASIFLRMCTKESIDDIFNSIQAVTCPQMDDFPKVQKIVTDTVAAVAGVELGRVMLVTLKPGGVITAHSDEGRYPEYYNRYHVPILSDNCKFTIDGNDLYMREGGLYLIDNQLEHSVENLSNQERIHLIMDIKGL
jgi:quercetin dioxygenase-like cupin family protein